MIFATDSHGRVLEFQLSFRPAHSRRHSSILAPTCFPFRLPITSQRLEKNFPFEVALKKGTANLPKDSKVKADQIRSIDKRRIVKRIGTLDGERINLIEKALKIHLNL
jgi:mRNA-degrading endonuclease toxin of MazEF toxin-antitoxin module